MPIGFGPWELLIILLIIVVLFGASRLSEIGGALGKGIKDFKAAAGTDSETVLPRPASGAPAESRCSSCGATSAAGQPFCAQCGTRLVQVT